MKRTIEAALKTAMIAMLAFQSIGAAPPAGVAPEENMADVDVLDGTATFDVGTNVSAISVHGKSTKLRGHAQIRQDGEMFTIARLEAALPVTTITTGMGLRDTHMRRYVFTTQDGQVPDLKFAADRADCLPAAGGKSICKVSGRLSIRGTAAPFAIALTVSRLGDTYKASGGSVVKLSAYGIPPPSQLGVTTSDEVELHLDFMARAASTPAVQGTGGIR